MSRTSPKNPPIAVVGVSALFPGSTDAGGFWADILAGTDCITDVPPSHWLIDDFYDPDPSKMDKTYCKRGGFLGDVSFDCMDFGTPPNLLQHTDTTQLLGLIVARQVLEDAARGPFEHLDKSRLSVILGATGTTELVVHLGSRLQRPIWLKALRDEGVPEDEAQRICQRISDSFVPWSEASFPGLLGNVIAGRIANRFDFGGTNCVVDAACASSQSAISMAINELYLGQSDMVITGGVDTLNDIFMYMCFSKTPALSPSGDCRPFSNKADGTILGEGLSMLALRRLEDAERDGDRIYAVIKGMGSSSDGKGNSVYAPNPKGQAICLERTYQAAGFSPASVELIEAHGTGTKAGDKAEFEGLRQVFEGSGRKGEPWCTLGSVKSQIGHTKGAAGAASMFKAVMALHHKVLPPTIKVDRPNPNLSMESSPFFLSTKARPWVRDAAHPRRAGVSSFGFGGSNFHVALEEYVGSKREDLFRPSPSQLILISATTPSELASLCADFIDGRSGPEALLFLARRSVSQFSADLPARLALVATDLPDLAKKLEIAAAQILKQPNQNQQGPQGWYYKHNQKPGKVAYLFPGQGSHYLGMGADLAMAFDCCREVWDKAACLHFENGTLLHHVTFPPPTFDDEATAHQKELLTKTQWAQPAIGTVSLSQLALLRSLGVDADCFGGHSFGEITALHAAGVFDDITMLQIARERGELMAHASSDQPGAMTVVSHPTPEVEALIAEINSKVVIANRNAPRQVVLAGPTLEMETLEARLAQDEIRFKRLPVATAFHSEIVSSASVPFAAFLAEKSCNPPLQPVYANTTATPYSSTPEDMRATLAHQLARPVQFVAQIEAMYAAGVRTFIEVGPNEVLSNLVKEILADRPFSVIPLDHKNKHGLTSLWHALGRMAVAGVNMDLKRLWEPLVAVQDPAKRKTSKLSVVLKGVNHGKPYPPENGTAGLPKPNPTRPALNNVVSTEPPAGIRPPTTTARPKKDMNLASSQQLLNAKTQHASPAATQRPTITATPKPVTPEAPLASAQSGTPLAANQADQWLAAFQAVQSQTAAAHMAFLGVAERSLMSLEAILPNAAGQAQVPAGKPVTLAKMHHEPASIPVAPRPAPPARVAPAPVIAKPAPAPVIAKPVPEPVLATLAPEAPLDLESLMLNVVADKTGYPAEMLEMDMNLEADLGIDSIKRVEILSTVQERVPNLPKIDPTAMSSLQTLGEIAAYMTASTNKAVAVKPSPALASPAVDLNQIMLAVVAEKTGYPSEMLEMDMNLEADLGIDSIKRVEILSTVQERVPNLPKIDPATMSSLQTLGEIASYMGNTNSSQAPAPAPPAEDLNQIMLAVVAEKTGYPSEMLEMDMNLEADLGIDSIKRVEILSTVQERVPNLPKIDPGTMSSLQTLGEIARYMASTDSSPPPATPVPATPELDLNQIMLAVVAEKTGYPIEMLEMDMNLEADLGIDSIKRVEILSTVQERVPNLAKIDPATMSILQTLGEIARYMGAESSGAPAPSAPTQPNESNESNASSTQVHRYSLTPVEHAAPGLAPPFLHDGDPVYVYINDNGSGIANKLTTELRGRGISAQACEQVPADAKSLILLEGLSEVTSEEAALEINRKTFQVATTVAAHFENEGGLFITVQDTGGDFGFSGIQSPNEWLGGLSGLVKTAAQEWPKATVRAIDLERGNRSDNQLVIALADEILMGGRDLEIGLKADGRRLTLRSEVADALVGKPVFDAQSVIVASGGARGVTAACLIALAEAHQPRIALLGRTKLEQEPSSCLGIDAEPALKKALLADAQARGEKISPRGLGRQVSRILANREIRETLARLEAAGSEACYHSSDITSASSVTSCLESVRKRWGPITGLIHGAGILADKLLSEKTEEQFDGVFGTKVGGLRLLLEATRNDPLSGVCLFSSVAARCGNAGQSDYAMANEVLNRIAQAEAKRRPDSIWKAINWGPWESGMVTPALKAKFLEMGVPLIPLSEGAKRFVDEMTHGESQQREVVVGGPPQNKALVNPNESRESQLDALVGCTSHPYLYSHAIDGMVVVPVVQVLEWFLSAARSIHNNLSIAAVKHLQVYKGIQLPDFDNEISRFKIKVSESGNNAEGMRLTLLDLEGKPRYGAVIEMATSQPETQLAMPQMKLNPVQLTGSDIYGEKLFHGPDFAAIQSIDALGEQGARSTLVGTRQLEWPATARITDPAILDGGLQTALIWAYEQLGKRSLPTSFTELLLYQTQIPSGTVQCFLSGNIDPHIGSESNLSFFDEQGKPLAEIRGLKMHVIDKARNPTPDTAVRNI